MNKSIGINQTFYYIIVTIVNFFIFSYINYLEKTKCICSKDWKRIFIKVVSVLIPLLIIFMYVSALGLKNFKLTLATLIVYSILTMVYIVITFSYFLKINKCDCSKGVRRFFLIYPLSVLIPVFIIIFLKLLTRKAM